jgi:hypothetical protein
MSKDLNAQPWGAQDRFQAHFIIKTGDQRVNSEFLAKTKLKTEGHFAAKKVANVEWIGGNITLMLNADSELANMISKLPYNDAKIWIEPTRNGIRIHGRWKSSYEFGVSKELFGVYDRIASHVKRALSSPPV